jgi:hypothetical protein
MFNVRGSGKACGAFTGRLDGSAPGETSMKRESERFVAISRPATA